MSTCLGLYVEENIIKYAKVSKDNDDIKIDSFGIKFFDKIEEAIQQVIAETYSYKTPISINLSQENYHDFYLFSLLNKKDMQKVINTEFESICYENQLNKEAFETRYLLANDNSNKEKVKAIHISANKADLTKKVQQLDGYKIANISPIGISISNLLDINKKENVMIINIDDRTTLTTIIDEKIYNVDVLDEGMAQILKHINQKENSYLKAYEICKNTTIYTSEGKDLQYEENDYLDDIMPVLYSIVGQVRKVINDSLNRIDSIYLTGTASVINNIDIYFQEYLGDMKCEILKPYFIKNIPGKINMKDYIEVNSAIALALQGVGEGIKAVNFKKETWKDKLPEWMTADIGKDNHSLKETKENKDFEKLKNMFSLDMDFKAELSAGEKNLIRVAIGLLLIITVYIGFSLYLSGQMNKKQEEIAKATAQVQSQIALIQTDISKIKTNTSQYISMRQKLEDLNNQISEKNRLKNAIPTLLNQIMFIIPQEVQITSIENTSGTHIVINAQAERYEQLGYLKGKIKADGILLNVVSDSSQKQEGIVKVTIEGDLP